MSTTLAPSQTTLPAWAVSIRYAISSCAPERRLDRISQIFGFTPPSDLPRPGEAASYELPQWRMLAQKFQLDEEEHSKHSYIFRHPKLRRVMLAPAGTPGDFRAQMNAMADFRIIYRSEISKVLTITEMILPRTSDVELRDMKLPDFCDSIVGQLTKDDGTKALHSDEAREIRERNGMLVPLQTVVKYLVIIRSEFGVSFRQSLETLHLAQEQVQQITTFASNSRMINAMDMASEVLEGVKDLLEMLRKNDRMQKEKKRLEREARMAPKPAPPAPVVPAKTPKQIFEEAMRSHQTKIADCFLEAVQKTVALVPPAFPGADESAVKAALAERDAAVADRVETEAELQEALNKVENLQQTLMESEMTNPWEGRMRGFAEKLGTLLADNDITKLIFNLDEARKLVADAKALTEPKPEAKPKESVAA